MYKTVSIVKIANSGKSIKFYGIKSNKTYYPDLSSDKEEVDKLCRLCNELQIDDKQIQYVIDDFLNSKSRLAPELTGG